VRAHVAVADLDDPVGDAVEEVAVVTDRDHRAVVALDRRLERLDRIVEVRDGDVRAYEGGFSAWERARAR